MQKYLDELDSERHNEIKEETIEILNSNNEWFFWYGAGLVIGLIVGIIFISGIRKYYFQLF